MNERLLMRTAFQMVFSAQSMTYLYMKAYSRVMSMARADNARLACFLALPMSLETIEVIAWCSNICGSQPTFLLQGGLQLPVCYYLSCQGRPD